MPDEPLGRLTIRAYGRARKDLGLPGTSHPAVLKAMERLGFERGEDGLIDADALHAAWEAERATSAAAGGGNQEQEAAAPSEEVTTDDDNATISEARRRKELALARKREAEVDVLRGKLVSREAAASAVFEANRITRDRMLLLPDRLAEQLATESDPDQVRALLEAEIRSALEAAVVDLDRLAESR